MLKSHLWIFLLVLLVLLTGACTSNMSKKEINYENGEPVFTLQLLHFSDIDGNEEIALEAVENFSALVNGFKADPMYGEATLVVSSGDNIIPGPRFYAAEQGHVRAVTGSNEPGHADIAFMNYLGVSASVLGNHDLDASPGELVDAISAEESKGVQFPGATFPYLSANVDWSRDEDTAELQGENGAMLGDLQGKFAASAVVRVAGETIGLVGASTPLLSTITSTGGLVTRPDDTESIPALVAEIQPYVDELTAKGVNKIIILSHLQQI